MYKSSSKAMVNKKTKGKRKKKVERIIMKCHHLLLEYRPRVGQDINFTLAVFFCLKKRRNNINNREHKYKTSKQIMKAA